MKKIFVITALTLFAATYVHATYTDTAATLPKNIKHAAPEAELTMPAGFKATVVATGLSGARHLEVTANGGIYVKLGWLKDGKGIYYLKDNNGDGVAEEQTGFGNYPGTGVHVYKGYLYASSNSEVFRYKLNDKQEVVNTSAPEKMITGLLDHGRDNAKPFTFDGNGNMYVTIGSYSTSCIVTEGQLKGAMPCPILDSAGGIWKFNAGKPNQTFKDGVKYATGIKNAVGIFWNKTTNTLFATQHGRDQLNKFFPQYYTAEQENLLPAETMFELHAGSNAGWPYIYGDPFTHKKMQAPEYGGDGKKTGGEKALNPTVSFPAHLAPNDILFYTGNSFPAKYKNGAFIAFHGKSAQLNKGYLVAFIPFKNGKPSGEWEIFADGFGGKDYATNGKAPAHKPCGLAQGPDGALYVSDDIGGTIFRIQYSK